MKISETRCRDWWDDIPVTAQGCDHTPKQHPFQKPLDLINRMIKASSDENDAVLDCFIGSGTTAVACKRLNRHFIGFEIDKKYCDISNKRLMNIPDRLENWLDVN